MELRQGVFHTGNGGRNEEGEDEMSKWSNTPLIATLNAMLMERERREKAEKEEQNEQNEGAAVESLFIEKIIEALNCIPQVDSPCTCDAAVICSNATEKSVPVHIKTDSETVHLADLYELNKTDIRLEKNFDGCLAAESGLCKIAENYLDWIEDNEWKDADEMSGQGEGKETLSLENSFMICARYNGIIYFHDDGQNVRMAMDSLLKEKGKQEIEIASWLIGYAGKPDWLTQGGTRVTYSFEKREALRQEVNNPSFDWYSYEGEEGKNIFAAPYLEGQEFISSRYGEGELTDENGYYWITLGPKVFIPDYPDEGKCETEEFKEYIGCRVDVVLRKMDYDPLEDGESEYVYIKCVWSGNIKAHTFDDGIIQTGIPYPNSSVAKTEPYQEAYVNGSIVEFTGKIPSTNGSMSQYVVEELIIYPKNKEESNE